MAAGRRDSSRRTADETRLHVLDIATDLFYWQGIRATGVDAVAAAAGIAPTTLYRVFASKDELVTAYLEHNDARYREWVDAAVEADGRDARARVEALFAALAAHAQPDVCRGCPYLMALAEYPDAASGPHVVAVRAKSWTRQRIGDVTAELGLPRRAAATLADRLTLVFEGVWASVAALGADGPAREAQRTALALVDLAVG